MSRHPEILWAQRSDKVFITVELPDAKNPQVKLEPDGRFTFTATVGASDTKFETDLELFGAIDVDNSHVNKGLRHTSVVLEKAEKEWWKRLLKAEGKAPTFVKVDWNKWVDEDEEDEAPKMDNFDLGGMGGMGGMESMMGGMGGMGGMDFGNMDDDDEDEDDLPELKAMESGESEAAVESEPTNVNVEKTTEEGAQESEASAAAKV